MSKNDGEPNQPQAQERDAQGAAVDALGLDGIRKQAEALRREADENPSDYEVDTAILSAFCSAVIGLVAAAERAAGGAFLGDGKMRAWSRFISRVQKYTALSFDDDVFADGMQRAFSEALDGIAAGSPTAAPPTDFEAWKTDYIKTAFPHRRVWNEADVRAAFDAGVAARPTVLKSAQGWRRTAPETLAEFMVREIITRDIPHRKGWRPSERARDLAATVRDLFGEARELRDAVNELKHAEARRGESTEWTTPYDEALSHAREENADVYANVLQLAYRLGQPLSELDNEAAAKLRMRFVGDANTPGADTIPLPSGGSGMTASDTEHPEDDPRMPEVRGALLFLLTRLLNPAYEPTGLEEGAPERILSSAEVEAITGALDRGVRSLPSLVESLRVTSPALADELAPFTADPIGSLLD